MCLTETQLHFITLGNIVKLHFVAFSQILRVVFNPLSANPTKWSNTLKQFVGKLINNCSKNEYIIDAFLKISKFSKQLFRLSLKSWLCYIWGTWNILYYLNFSYCRLSLCQEYRKKIDEIVHFSVKSFKNQLGAKKCNFI